MYRHQEAVGLSDPADIASNPLATPLGTAEAQYTLGTIRGTVSDVEICSFRPSLKVARYAKVWSPGLSLAA
jgi:hypothetical protein